MYHDVKMEVGNTILFVGAGVSMHLGLPSWQQLIDEIAKQLKYDPRIFKLLGTPLSLAEYYKLEHGNIGPLRSWMDQEGISRESMSQNRRCIGLLPKRDSGRFTPLTLIAGSSERVSIGELATEKS
jgi:hypothetical protein